MELTGSELTPTAGVTFAVLGAALLVALASGLWFGETLSAGAWTGVLLISGGVLSLAFVGRARSRAAGTNSTAATLWALLSAWPLKEGHLRERLAGAAAVLAGLIALKLSL